MSGRFALLLVLLLASLWTAAEARYLPTRGQDDQLDRIRELMRYVMENKMEEPNIYDSMMHYKREVPEAVRVLLEQARQSRQ
ncbi:uncharacterized protein LOC134529963 [Bacillus rossius redtenbacheri]|uniref:uncharacterized protein LOC134529963 n=1 Tax=Bacillus rossius redtenbacheri TaxID=93214 RepID=UPI002FDE9E72